MRALRVYEAMDFERGRDPKTTLNIGLTAKRDFDTIDELVEWMFRFPEVFSEGQIREWDYKIERKKYGPDYYVIQYPQLRRNLLEYVKWIKKNIKNSYGYDWGLKDSKDAFNSLERFLIDRSEKRVHESVSFQRGQDPKSSMGIGLGDYFEADDALTLGQASIEREEIQDRLDDGERLIFVKNGYTHTSSSLKYNGYKNVLLGNKIYYLGESVQFQRGLDPKRAMDIGLTSRQRYDSIAPGDIYVTLVSMPGIHIKKNSYILVLSVSDDAYNHKDIRYAISSNLKHLKSEYNKMGFSYWGWPFDFFNECLRKVDHIDL
jgi:hypothetical protein